MRLNYFKENNFGDALNPIIFNKVLPGFFDEDPNIEFFGIGSIIGLPMVHEAKNKIIFSSGYAYGSPPKVDDSFEVICVRGPLTAKAFDFDPKLAVVDGAALLREFNFPQQKKEYEFSFMPHWTSEDKYPWENICAEAGIHYVSPREEPMHIIDEILKSKVVLAEAMHYAIVADALRVPWVAVKAYPGINEFKWNDWAESLDLDYKPQSLGPLFKDSNLMYESLKKKTKNKYPDVLYSLGAKSLYLYQQSYLKRAVVKRLTEAKNISPQLSNDSLFNGKVDQLLELLHKLEKKYQKV